MQVAVAPQAVI